MHAKISEADAASGVWENNFIELWSWSERKVWEIMRFAFE